MERSNILGVMPVKRLMISMGVPMIMSMLLQAFYNIVDSAFVSNMKENGEAALNALTLAFPMQMLMVALSIGTGVGVGALLSKSLGQSDSEKASRTAGCGLFLALVIYLMFLLFGFFGVKAFIGFQTKNRLIAGMGADYLRICCVWSFGIVFFSIYEKLLQATGRSAFSTVAQISGAVTNMILDPLLIYGLLGLPKLGVKGAAYATVIGQIVSFLAAMAFHLKKNIEIRNSLSFMVPSAKIIKEIYAIGLPAIIAQALMSVMTYLLNMILGGISESMVTAYGLFYKVQQFVLFAAFGLRDAITPIVSYSHGMKDKKRIGEGIKYGLLYTCLIMAAGTLAVELFAGPFSKMFGLSGQTRELCVSAMRLISISFVFAGANIAFQGIFQALDGGPQSLAISLCRQLIFVLPAAKLFAVLVKNGSAPMSLIWIAFPLAEILSALIAFLMMKSTRTKLAV
ncbi:MAG: MATE family efflux transporter [Ruminococcus sp.]|nr:MATE family efflux transporter [Ruminococcus sp.]